MASTTSVESVQEQQGVAKKADWYRQLAKHSQPPFLPRNINAVVDHLSNRRADSGANNAMKPSGAPWNMQNGDNTIRGPAGSPPTRGQIINDIVTNLAPADDGGGVSVNQEHYVRVNVTNLTLKSSDRLNNNKDSLDGPVAKRSKLPSVRSKCELTIWHKSASAKAHPGHYVQLLRDSQLCTISRVSIDNETTAMVELDEPFIVRATKLFVPVKADSRSHYTLGECYRLQASLHPLFEPNNSEVEDWPPVPVDLPATDATAAGAAEQQPQPERILRLDAIMDGFLSTPINGSPFDIKYSKYWGQQRLHTTYALRIEVLWHQPQRKHSPRLSLNAAPAVASQPAEVRKNAPPSLHRVVYKVQGEQVDMFDKLTCAFCPGRTFSSETPLKLHLVNNHDELRFTFSTSTTPDGAELLTVELATRQAGSNASERPENSTNFAWHMPSNRQFDMARYLSEKSREADVNKDKDAAEEERALPERSAAPQQKPAAVVSTDADVGNPPPVPEGSEANQQVPVQKAAPQDKPAAALPSADIRATPPDPRPQELPEPEKENAAPSTALPPTPTPVPDAGILSPVPRPNDVQEQPKETVVQEAVPAQKAVEAPPSQDVDMISSPRPQEAPEPAGETASQGKDPNQEPVAATSDQNARMPSPPAPAPEIPAPEIPEPEISEPHKDMPGQTAVMHQKPAAAAPAPEVRMTSPVPAAQENAEQAEELPREQEVSRDNQVPVALTPDASKTPQAPLPETPAQNGQTNVEQNVASHEVAISAPPTKEVEMTSPEPLPRETQENKDVMATPLPPPPPPPEATPPTSFADFSPQMEDSTIETPLIPRLSKVNPPAVNKKTSTTLSGLAKKPKVDSPSAAKKPAAGAPSVPKKPAATGDQASVSKKAPAAPLPLPPAPRKSAPRTLPAATTLSSAQKALVEQHTLPKRRPKKYRVPPALAGHRYYRTKAKRPVAEGEQLSDSDEDMDESWLTQMHNDAIDGMRALTAGEKAFIKRWDEHIQRREHIVAARFLGGALVRFADANKDWLGNEEGMAVEFYKHASSLLATGSVSHEIVQTCIEIVRSAKGTGSATSP